MAPNRIENLVVHGHAIVGDHGTIVAGSYLERQAVVDALRMLQGELSQQQTSSLPVAERAELDRRVQELEAELKQQESAQQRVRIGELLSRFGSLVAGLPKAVEAVGNLRVLLGL